VRHVQQQKGLVLLPGSEAVGQNHCFIRWGSDAEDEQGQHIGIGAEGWTGDGGGQKADQWIGWAPGRHSGAELPTQGTAHFPRADCLGHQLAGAMGSAHDKLLGPNRPHSGGEEQGRGFRIGGFGIGGSGSEKKKGKGKEKGQGKNAENGNRDGDRDGNGDEDEDADGDLDGSADGNETMGKSM
jgi:hypothetical protein